MFYGSFSLCRDSLHLSGMGVPFSMLFTFGCVVTWLVKPHIPCWWSSDKSESASVPKVILGCQSDTQFLSLWTKDTLVSVCTCMHEWIMSICKVLFIVFMPKAMNANSRSVTVRAPCVKCVGVCFFLLWVCAVVFTYVLCVFAGLVVLIAAWQRRRDSWAKRHRSRYYPSCRISSLPPHHHLWSAALAVHQPPLSLPHLSKVSPMIG